MICELRRAHRRWGPRRLVFELDRGGYPGLSRSTIYRVLVRRQLIEPVPRRKRRDQYRRWERPAPMQLWQMDVTASLFLADGRECKIITGIAGPHYRLPHQRTGALPAARSTCRNRRSVAVSIVIMAVTCVYAGQSAKTGLAVRVRLRPFRARGVRTRHDIRPDI